MEISAAGKTAVNRPSFPLLCYRELLEKMEKTDDSGIVYPESDGKPVGETEAHVMATFHLYDFLRFFFKNAHDVYTVAAMLMFYEKGNPKAFKVPDVMVVKGVGKHLRRNFKLWKEKAIPTVIFEITSKSSVAEDISKTGLYANLGVKEYFLFDPLDEYLEEGFTGFRLDGLMFTPLAPEADGSFFSAELGLILKREGNLVRVIDPKNGRAIPTLTEAIGMIEEASKAREGFRGVKEVFRKSACLAAKLREMGIDPDSV